MSAFIENKEIMKICNPYKILYGKTQYCIPRVYRVDLNFVIFKIILIAVFISKHTVKATWVLMFFVYLSG